MHIKEEGANHIKYYNNDGVEVEYPADRSGRLKSQDDYKKIKEDFININEIDENTLDGQNKLKNFQRYVKGPLTGPIRQFFSSNTKANKTSNFLSSNQNSVAVGGRRKSKKTKRKSLKRGRKTRKIKKRKGRKSRKVSKKNA